MSNIELLHSCTAGTADRLSVKSNRSIGIEIVDVTHRQPHVSVELDSAQACHSKYICGTNIKHPIRASASQTPTGTLFNRKRLTETAYEMHNNHRYLICSCFDIQTNPKKRRGRMCPICHFMVAG